MHYYQFNIKDFALHASHLTLEEEGVYRRLLDYYYDAEGPIPTETQRVIRRLRLGSYVSEVEQILSEFFTLEDDGYHNYRADIEIEAYKKNADTARANGKKGGRPPKNKGPETQRVNLANPDETGLKANQEPVTSNHKPLTTNHKNAMPSWVDQYTSTFWKAYPKKKDKKLALERLKRMIKAKPDPEFFEMILDRINQKALVTEKKFWASPDRYLKDELWEDEIIENKTESKLQNNWGHLAPSSNNQLLDGTSNYALITNQQDEITL